MSLLSTIRRDMARLMADKSNANVADVTIVWNTADLGAVDPNLEGALPTAALQSGTWPALVHYVQPITSGLRQFAEIQVGDVILDFAFDAFQGVGPSGPEADFPENAPGATVRIENNPAIYVQKAVGKDLLDAWDVAIGGQRVFRTVVVTKAGL